MTRNLWRLPILLLVTASAVGVTDYLLDPHSERLPAWVCWGLFLAAWTTTVVSWRTHRRYLRRWSGGATFAVVLLEMAVVSYVHFACFPCSLRPNTPEEQQFADLMMAVNSNSLGQVQSILACDKNPNFVPLQDYVTEVSSHYYNDNRTPFEIAISGGRVEIAQALLDHGASIAKSKPDPLALSAKTGDIPMMRMFIAKGMPVNDFGVQDRGSSALWHAVEEEKVEAVAFLLAHGANPNTRHPDFSDIDDYANVMRLARYTGNIPIAKMLKKAGATE